MQITGMPNISPLNSLRSALESGRSSSPIDRNQIQEHVFNYALEHTKRLFSTKDANRDGSLSTDELGVSAEHLAKTGIDIDQDGVLSVEEVQRQHIENVSRELQRQMTFHRAAEHTLNLFYSKDSNRDGLLTAGELGISQKELLRSGIDKDKDRALSIAEVQERHMQNIAVNHQKRAIAAYAAMQAENLFKTKDADHNGQLTAEELGISKDEFEKSGIDSDKNGSFTAPEIHQKVIQNITQAINSGANFNQPA